jgi:hypothetical protein
MFKLKLRFDICCFTSEAREALQIEENPSLLYDRSMPHIHIKLGHQLTCCTLYPVVEAEGTEGTLRIVLKLLDNMPEKADLLAECGVHFLRTFDNANRKEDINNCILAYESAVRLTPQGHSDMPSRLNRLGVSFSRRFGLTGNIADISNAISYQQTAVHLTPDGHANMLSLLNNLGEFHFKSCFKRCGDFADIFDAISYQQKAVHLTPEGHPNMSLLLNNLGSSIRSRFERT